MTTARCGCRVGVSQLVIHDLKRGIWDFKLDWHLCPMHRYAELTEEFVRYMAAQEDRLTYEEKVHVQQLDE